MNALDRRLQKLEARAASGESTLLDMLFQVLAGDFGPDFKVEADRALEELGRKASWRVSHLENLRDRGIADILRTGADRAADLERFRGLVPGRVLEAVSAAMGKHGLAAAA